ncbi:unnamed protein product [Closterium sp. NIES-54]
MELEQVDPPGSILCMGPPLASAAAFLPIACLGRTPFVCLPRAHGAATRVRVLAGPSQLDEIKARAHLPCRARTRSRPVLPVLGFGGGEYGGDGCVRPPFAPPPSPSPTAVAAAEGGGCVGAVGVVLRGWRVSSARGAAGGV